MSAPHEHHREYDLGEVEIRLNGLVLELLSGYPDLNVSHLRMLFYALSQMDPRTGLVPLERLDVADHIRVGEGTVSRATRKLTDLGLLWRVDNEHLKINPHLAFRGETREAWASAIHAFDTVSTDEPALQIPQPEKPSKRPSRAGKTKRNLRLVK